MEFDLLTGKHHWTTSMEFDIAELGNGGDIVRLYWNLTSWKFADRAESRRS